MRQVIVPPELAEAVRATGFSPAVRAGDFVFLTGATGGDAQGTMPADVDIQTRNALAKALTVLKAAGGTAQSIVELTSFHIGLHNHFDRIDALFREMLGAPLPAWTAVEVAGLRRPGALVEFRIVAYLPT